MNPPTGSSATKVVQPHLVGGAGARPEGAAAGTAVCPAPRAAAREHEKIYHPLNQCNSL